MSEGKERVVGRDRPVAVVALSVLVPVLLPTACLSPCSGPDRPAATAAAAGAGEADRVGDSEDAEERGKPPRDWGCGWDRSFSRATMAAMDIPPGSG